MEKKSTNVPVTSRIPQDAKADLSELAEEEGVSRSALIAEMVDRGLEDWGDREEDDDRPTRFEEAVRSVENLMLGMTGFFCLIGLFSWSAQVIGLVPGITAPAAVLIGYLLLPTALLVMLLAAFAAYAGIARTIGIKLENGGRWLDEQLRDIGVVNP